MIARKPSEREPADRSLHWQREAGRAVRFAVVGASGTVVDWGLLALLKALGAPTLPANLFSYSAGIVNNFVWNRRFTFPDADKKQVAAQFAQFVLVSLIGLLINTTIVMALEVPLTVAVGGVGLFVAKAIATIGGVGWNFTANRFWTFKPQTP